MRRDFPLKEIALQAGLSLATVDRALHRRAGVRAQTLQRVEHALRELRRQSEQTTIPGRKFMIDLVMSAPDRFTSVVREALEAEMPLLRPSVFRCRFYLSEEMDTRVEHPGNHALQFAIGLMVSRSARHSKNRIGSPDSGESP